MSTYRPIEREYERRFKHWREETSPFTFLMVKAGMFRRFKVRWEERDFPEATYDRVTDAIRRLRDEREVPDPRPKIHVLDRLTGRCFTTPPRMTEDIIAGRCIVCRAEPGWLCDAGVHS